MINIRAATDALTPARRAVLVVLSEESGPLTATSVGERLGLHHNTVREHLSHLVATGLVDRTAEDTGARGRPSWRYRAATSQTSKAIEYADLAAALAHQLEHGSGDPRKDSMAAGETWGEDLTDGPVPGEGVRSQVVKMLDELGFNPDATGEDGRIRLRSCPLLDVAQRHPEVVCGVHQGMIRGVVRNLGGDPDSADLLAFFEPDSCHLTLGPQ